MRARCDHDVIPFEAVVAPPDQVSRGPSATAPHPKRQHSTSQSQSHSSYQLSPSPQIKPFVHASQLLLMIPVAIHWFLTGCSAQSSLDTLQSFHHAYASSLAHPPHLTSSPMLGRQLVLLDLVLVRIPPESSPQTQAVVPHELHVLPWQLSNSCFDFDHFTFPSSLEAAASPTELHRSSCRRPTQAVSDMSLEDPPCHQLLTASASHQYCNKNHNKPPAERSYRLCMVPAKAPVTFPRFRTHSDVIATSTKSL